MVQNFVIIKNTIKNSYRILLSYNIDQFSKDFKFKNENVEI